MSTTPKRFIIPILKVLERHGGSANTDIIKRDLLEEMRPMLEQDDYEMVPISATSEEPRWWNNSRHAADQMRKKGLLAESVQKGIWEITETGRLKIPNSKKITVKTSTPARDIPTLADEDADSSIDEYNLDDADHRELVERQIRARRGQQQFRNALLKQYQNVCVVTGCKIVAILEAAHIKPYRGENDNYPSNGLLLRADIHTLFDLDLLGIEPTSLRVELHRSIAEYKDIVKKLNVPNGVRPSLEALKYRYEQFNKRKRI